MDGSESGSWDKIRSLIREMPIEALEGAYRDADKLDWAPAPLMKLYIKRELSARTEKGIL